jgi:hypothetical protein
MGEFLCPLKPQTPFHAWHSFQRPRKHPTEKRIQIPSKKQMKLVIVSKPFHQNEKADCIWNCITGHEPRTETLPLAVFYVFFKFPVSNWKLPITQPSASHYHACFSNVAVVEGFYTEHQSGEHQAQAGTHLFLPTACCRQRSLHPSLRTLKTHPRYPPQHLRCLLHASLSSSAAPAAMIQFLGPSPS